MNEIPAAEPLAVLVLGVDLKHVHPVCFDPYRRLDQLGLLLVEQNRIADDALLVASWHHHFEAALPAEGNQCIGHHRPTILGGAVVPRVKNVIDSRRKIVVLDWLRPTCWIPSSVELLKATAPHNGSG